MAVNLKILYWNYQRAGNKKSELLQHIKQNKIQRLLLNETHFTSKSKFNFPNYQTYQNHRPNIMRNHGSGETVILVLKNINNEVNIHTNSIENTIIHVMINNRKTRLSAVYKSPSTTIQLADINTLLDITILPTIIAGDLNAKHIAWHSNL